jgi:hypothetical protein
VVAQRLVAAAHRRGSCGNETEEKLAPVAKLISFRGVLLTGGGDWTDLGALRPVVNQLTWFRNL